jgi:SAM-dependent methyltransferase
MDKSYLAMCDFDVQTYKGANSDLTALGDKDLENHFLTHGINEGRLYNQIRNRKDFVDLISNQGKMLEIGPLDNPQLDFNSPDYFSLDVFDKEQLIENYKNDPTVKKENIIQPTYIIQNSDYSVITETFKSVFSSHSIEHMPCVVTFLDNLARLLQPDGFIYLIVPDKRYCFDYFKKETDIFDVLQMHYEENTRPRLADVLRLAAQITHNDAGAHWNGEHGSVNPELLLHQHYQPILDRYKTGVYIDAHVSFFTPQSFADIIRQLKSLNLIQLDVHKIYHTVRGALEFYVILKPDKNQI